MKNYFVLYFLFTLSFSLNATHNLAGEITVRQIDDLTAEALVNTYTEASSVSADRDSLTIQWGDGSSQVIYRVNGPDLDNNGFPDGELIGNDIKRNIYAGTHTYASVGVYVIGMTDPNRSADIININGPGGGSINVPFHIQTEFHLVDLTQGEPNQTPVLLEYPIDLAYVGQPFVHVPNAFDPDDDSIAYELITPFQGPDLSVPGYVLPNAFPSPSPNNSLGLHPETGVLTWETPQAPGKYIIAILIKSFRNGVATDRIIRDMEIIVLDEEELASQISWTGAMTGVFIPVSLNDTVKVQFEFSEPDAGQALQVTSTCGLYDYYTEPAVFNSVVNNNTGSAAFEWVVREEHLRQHSYQLVVQAVGEPSENALAAFAVFRFVTVDFVFNGPEPDPQTNVKIRPNPASDYLLLTMDGPLPATVQLIDATGRLMQSVEVTNPTQMLSLRGIPDGWYVAMVQAADATQTSVPVVINRKGQ